MGPRRPAMPTLEHTMPDSPDSPDSSDAPPSNPFGRDPGGKIIVAARSKYLPEQSDEKEDRYVFAYTVTIRNVGSMAAKLVSRHWVITDSNNKVQEVRGLGVVGEQPTIEPGAEYEYSSGAAIATPVGTMRGSYQMVAADGRKFDAPIPEFALSIPRVLH